MRSHVVAVTCMCWLAGGAPAALGGASGPGLYAPERDDRVKREVRQTLRSIKDAMGIAKKARTAWRIERATLKARKADADAALADCKQRNGDGWAQACRVQLAESDTVDEEFREAMIVAIERYEQKFAPLSRVVHDRVESLVLDARNYRHLLAQSDRGGHESRLLKLLMISLDKISEMKAKMNEAITLAYLGDLVETVKALEEDIQDLERMTPEIQELVDNYEHNPVPQDSLMMHAYPAM